MSEINAPLPTRKDYEKTLELLFDTDIMLQAIKAPDESFIRIFEDKLAKIMCREQDISHKVQHLLEPVVLMAMAEGAVNGVLTSWTLGVLFGYLLRESTFIREMNEAIKQ